MFLQTCGSKNWATANQSLRLGWPNSPASSGRTIIRKVVQCQKRQLPFHILCFINCLVANLFSPPSVQRHIEAQKIEQVFTLTVHGIRNSQRSFYVIPFKVECQGLFEVRDVQVHDQGSSHKLQDVQDRSRRVQVLAHGCLHILDCTLSCTTDLPKSRSNIHLENDEGGVRWVVLIALFAAFLVVLSALLSLFGVVFLLGVLVVCWGLVESVAIYWGVASLKMVAVAVASRAKANKC